MENPPTYIRASRKTSPILKNHLRNPEPLHRHSLAIPMICQNVWVGPTRNRYFVDARQFTRWYLLDVCQQVVVSLHIFQLDQMFIVLFQKWRKTLQTERYHSSFHVYIFTQLSFTGLTNTWFLISLTFKLGPELKNVTTVIVTAP